MTRDAWLAIAHHAGAFGLLAVLVVEWAIVRPGIDRATGERVARIDALYGGFAGLVVVAGISRIAWGDKPADFYLENPVFWLKMAAIATVGLLSVPPTLRYVRWRKAPDAPPEADVRSTMRSLRAQLVVFPLIPALAAVMARGIGL